MRKFLWGAGCALLFTAPVGAQELRRVATDGEAILGAVVEDVRLPRINREGDVAFVATTDAGDLVYLDRRGSLNPGLLTPLAPLSGGLPTSAGVLEIGAVRQLHLVSGPKVLVEAELGTDPPRPGWFWARTDGLEQVAWHGRPVGESTFVVGESAQTYLDSDGLYIATDGRLWRFDEGTATLLIDQGATTIHGEDLELGQPWNAASLDGRVDGVPRPITLRDGLRDQVPTFAPGKPARFLSAQPQFCFGADFPESGRAAIACNGGDNFVLAQRDSPDAELMFDGFTLQGDLHRFDDEVVLSACDESGCGVVWTRDHVRVTRSHIVPSGEVLGITGDQDGLLMAVRSGDGLSLTRCTSSATCEVFAALDAQVDDEFTIREFEDRPWVSTPGSARQFAGWSAVFLASDGDDRSIVASQIDQTVPRAQVLTLVQRIDVNFSVVTFDITAINEGNEDINDLTIAVSAPGARFTLDWVDPDACVNEVGHVECRTTLPADSFWPFDVRAVFDEAGEIPFRVETWANDPPVRGETHEFTVSVEEGTLPDFAVIATKLETDRFIVHVTNHGTAPGEARVDFTPGFAVDLPVGRCTRSARPSRWRCELGALDPGETATLSGQLLASGFRVLVRSTPYDVDVRNNEFVLGLLPEDEPSDEFDDDRDLPHEHTYCGIGSSGTAWLQTWRRR